MARERGLTPGAVPTLIGLSGVELRHEAVEQLRSDTPERARAAIERTLSRLELVPAGFDWLESIEQALEGRLRAFYAPERDAIFVDAALVGSARRHALTHELVHALQARHHDLGARLAYAPDAWDRQSALHAIAEGDAELLAERSRARALSSPALDANALAGPVLNEPPSAVVPDVLLRSLAAVYVDGRELVEPVLMTGGFAAVDALLRDPPLTTHALLHPLTAPREPPPPLALPPAPNASWQQGHTEILGEQTWRTVLEEWLPLEEAEQAASGWSADRLCLFERGRATALVWQVRSDARGQADAWGALRAQFGASRSPSDLHCRAHRDQGVVGVLRDKHDLWFLSLDDHEPVDAACHALRDWAARLKVANGTTTRVLPTSSVAADPAKRGGSSGSN